MAGDYVVYISVVRVRVASNLSDRSSRNLHRRWSQELLDDGEFHGCECPELGRSI